MDRLSNKLTDARLDTRGLPPLIDVTSTSGELAEEVALTEFKRDGLLRKRGDLNTLSTIWVLLFFLRLVFVPVSIDAIRLAASLQAVLSVGDLLLFLVFAVIARVRVALLNRQINRLELDIAQQRGRLEYLRNVATKG
jgi:hypothetical protein